MKIKEENMKEVAERYTFCKEQMNMNLLTVLAFPHGSSVRRMAENAYHENKNILHGMQIVLKAMDIKIDEV